MATASNKVRVLQEHEWLLLKELRLKALQFDPMSFWEDFETSKLHTDEYWKNLAKQLAEKDGSKMFILDNEKEAIGFIYGIKGKDADEFRLGGLWVDPENRSIGIGGILVNTVLEWAHSRSPSPNIKLWSPDDGTTDFYVKLGFQPLDQVKTHPKNPNRRIVEMSYSPEKKVTLADA